jgi:hypothetical protein
MTLVKFLYYTLQITAFYIKMQIFSPVLIMVFGEDCVSHFYILYKINNKISHIAKYFVYSRFIS